MSHDHHLTLQSKAHMMSHDHHLTLLYKAHMISHDHHLTLQSKAHMMSHDHHLTLQSKAHMMSHDYHVISLLTTAVSAPVWVRGWAPHSPTNQHRQGHPPTIPGSPPWRLWWGCLSEKKSSMTEALHSFIQFTMTCMKNRYSMNWTCKLKY